MNNNQNHQHAPAQDQIPASSVLLADNLCFAWPQCAVFQQLNLRLPAGATLLQGGEGSGKTTLLRSIARELVRQQKILSVIDERRELFAGNTHGEALDVLAGLPKGQAVQMALRTLSPQVILLDEL